MSSSVTSWFKFWDESCRTEQETSGGKTQLQLQSDFIRGTTSSTESMPTSTCCGWLRHHARRFSQSPCSTHLMALIVLFDAYCNINAIDARAAGNTTSDLLWVGSLCCLLWYTVEMMVMIFAQGQMVLKDVMFLMDLGVVTCGYVEVTLDLARASNDGIHLLGAIRLLRLWRVSRLLRIFGKQRSLLELQKLVLMASTCFKTLVWSFVFCFVVMTIWAMLLVEIVNPLIQELLEKDPGIFNECEHCTRATSSVMKANLLLFKTVIAGDSWGRIAVPVIEAYPATAIIFVGSQLTLVFGVLNLIVAVVVDTFADSRDRDILNLAEEMEQDRESDKQYLERIFNRIDLDGCGQLSLEQLVEGARKDQEFQSRLRVMDIDEADLVQLFDMIDTDGSGFIEPNEFIKPLSRWVHDSKTAPRFIKYNMMRLMNEQHEIREGQASLRKSMEKHFAEMARRLGSQQVSSSKMDDSERSVGDATKIDDSVGIATELLESLPLAPAGFPMESEYTAAMSELETMEQPPSSQPVMLWPSRATEEAEAEVQAAVGRLEELLKHTADPAFKESIANINEMLLDMRKLRQAEEPAPGPAPRVHAAVHPQLHQCASAPNDGSEKKATDRRSPGLLPSVKGNFQRIESM